MCEKKCQSTMLHASEAERLHGATFVRMSENDVLVVTSGPTTVTIFNGEVQINSESSVSFDTEAAPSLTPVAKPQPHQNFSQPCRKTTMQYAQWATPAQECNSPAAVRETSSTDGEEDIPSS